MAYAQKIPKAKEKKANDILKAYKQQLKKEEKEDELFLDKYEKAEKEFNKLYYLRANLNSKIWDLKIRKVVVFDKDEKRKMQQQIDKYQADYDVINPKVKKLKKEYGFYPDFESNVKY